MALVKGHALGGGCELAALCDTVIAHEDATFGLPEVNARLSTCRCRLFSRTDWLQRHDAPVAHWRNYIEPVVTPPRPRPPGTFLATLPFPDAEELLTMLATQK